MTSQSVITPRVVEGPEQLEALVGTILGPSGWVTLDQHRIDGFADATDDHYWGHVDAVRSQDTPFGKTIAHGLLTLAMHPSLLYTLVEFRGFSQMFHYGYDRVRFPGVVLEGSQIRLTVTVVDTARSDDGMRATFRMTIECEGSAKPVCSADYIQYFTW